jgi:phosphoglycerate dehydrogenase-like enzyme
MGTTLLILSKLESEYAALVRAAALPGIDEIRTSPSPECEVVLGEPHRIRDALAQLPSLRWAQCVWAGVEPLVDPALRRDYALTNARGVFGGLVAEYVFAYLLLRERRVMGRLEAQRGGRWDSAITGTLRGKAIGLLGVGSIGAALARAAKLFGMRVLGYTRVREACPHVDGFFHGEGLLDLARGSDYLVNTLPATPATRRIVGAEVLAALPPGAWFVNVGRGSAVDEAALVRALEGGALGGAVLDVLEQEPLPAGHPLWRTPNTFITGHTCAPSFPADIVRLFADNYGRYLRGEELEHRVDFERGY